MAVDEQGELQPVQRLDVVAATAPAGLRPPAERAQPGARCVDQHPGEGARAPGRAGPVGHQHGRRRRVGPHRLPDESSPGAARPRRPPDGSSGPASPASRAVLPPGPGAQVQPRPDRSRPTRASAAATSCEPSSCTPARPSRTAGRSAGLPDQRAAYGECRPGSAPAVVSSPTSASPGRTARVTGACVVVGAQRGLQLRVRQHVGERVDDPARVGGRDHQPVALVHSRR